MSTLTVPTVNDSSRAFPCAFDVPPCKDPGFIPELTLFTLKLLTGRNQSQIQFFPVENYDFTDDNTSSALNQIRDGWADLSEPDYLVTQSRSEKLPYIGPLIDVRYSFIYKSETKTPTLDSFYRLDWEFYGMLLLIFSAYYLCKKFLLRKVGKNWVLQKFFQWTEVIFALFLGVLLKYVSSHLVLLFLQLKEKPTFQRK